VLASRQRRTTEERLPNGDTPVWMETYKAAVLDEDGSTLGTVGISRDVSERKSVEAAREAALAEARQLAKQRSGFLAQMSHELRTPLSGILGFAQILQREQGLNALQTRGLKIIHESGEHLLALINDILDLARIDAAKLELVPTEVKLGSFMQVVCDIIRVKADEKGLQFDYLPGGELPGTVTVDHMRLRQVLLNLLSNAVKFTDHGRVRLIVTPVAPSTAGAPGADITRLRFEVVDEGIGLSDTQQARLFRPFEQVGELKRRSGGTGLGLAISQQLVQLMGGQIQLRSRPGAGSSFWFEIDVPTPPAPPPALALHGMPSGYKGPRRKVLVVDDTSSVRTLLVDLLSALGFEVAQAGDGAAGLAEATRFQPDLVIIDIMMPVMDGFEAMRHLRRRSNASGLRIIATSASLTPDRENRSLEAGADAFFSKPVDQPALLDTMAGLLGLSWTRPPAAS
jgi:signal transduction histidine kinase